MKGGSVARWLKFNSVGVMGVVGQLAALQMLSRIGVSYLAATVIAVECAVLHNFAWHERYTWRDRGASGSRVARLISFHVANGAVSILGNLALMWLLVGGARMPLLLANVISIVVCSTVNFLSSDRWVFRERGTSDSPTQAHKTKEPRGGALSCG